jgi:O-antigen/teichoic acid export membrane protein
MFPFGFRLLVATLLDVVFSNAYTLVIGKFYSARELGFYSRAEQLQKIPAVNLTSAVRRVIYPTFSKIQDDKARLKRGMRSTVQALALVICPVMIGIAVVAKPLVVTLLTEKWLPSVFYLQLFCAIGMLYPFHAINLSVLKARGRADLFLRLEIIKKALVVVAILVTYRWGISAIIIGSIVVSFMAFYLNAYYTGIHLGYSFKDQVKDVAPPFTVAMIMGACVHFLQFLNISSHLILLSLQVVVGILIYAMICALLRLSAFTGMWQLVRKSSRAA